MPVADLLAVAGRALADGRGGLPAEAARAAGTLAPALAAMLGQRDGFYAFGPALQVRPMMSSGAFVGLAAWNASTLWKDAYVGVADPGLCFAEDAFGNQFCIGDDKVQRFDIETGALEPFAETLDGWADRILAKSAVETGWPLADAWQKRHGPMPVGTRLHPATPFTAGGAYALDNLRPIPAVELMRSWGNFVRQTRGLPDGAKIRIVVGREP